MSLSAYQRSLARMVADPAFRRRVAADPAAALGGERLDARERRRLRGFADDPGMKVNTALYRANRLAPIFNSLPATTAELGDAIAPVLRGFWSSVELEDLQFPNEAARFVTYLRRHHADVLAARRGRAALLAVELAVFELTMAPRRALRAAAARRVVPIDRDPLVRTIACDVEPDDLVAVVVAGAALAGARPGAGAVRVDHRIDPGTITAI